MSSKASSRPRPGPTPPASVSNGKPNAWSRPLQPKPKQPTSSAPAGPPPGMGAPPILRERFLHLTLSMVGQKVIITKADGTVVEGVFHTFTPFQNTEIKYVLKACRGEGVSNGATVIMDAADVAHVHVKSMRLDTSNKTTNGDSFQTDVQISGAKPDVNRDLVAAGTAWTSSGHARAEGLAADRKGLKGNIGEWDQFKANEQLFNVSATFDENLYTTELDHSQIDGRKRMEAARLAKEIEGTASSNIHIAEERGQVVEGDYDEEDRYSGVLKPSLQPRNIDPRTAKQPGKTGAARSPKPAETEEAQKAAEPGKPAGPKKMNYAAAAAKAKADAKEAGPAGRVKPAVVTPSDEKKDEKKKENGEEVPAPITPTAADENTKKEEKETTDEPKNEEKTAEKEEEKKKPTSKLNANAKEFSFNPAAKSFTPSFGPPAAVSPAEMYPIDPNTGMPIAGPGVPQMQAQYMPHPGMAQPGMVPMMNTHFAAMRYPGPYPGMEHQMHMPFPQQPQHMQQPPSAPGSQQAPSAPGSQQPSTAGSVDGGDSPAPPMSGDDASLSASEGAAAPTLPQQPPQQFNPNQHFQQMPYGPPGSYYPAGMMPPQRGGHGGYPPPPQMGPGGNPYAHPMYGVPMPMAPNMMRGPGGNYYPPMGGMHYPPGAYGGGMMDDDPGFRGARGGRAGRGQRGRSSNRKGGRGGVAGRGYNSYGSGGGSGRQTPQSTSGVSDNDGDGGGSKPSSPTEEPPPKPSGEE